MKESVAIAFSEYLSSTVTDGQPNIQYFAAPDADLEATFGIGNGCVAMSSVLDEVDPVSGETIPGGESEVTAMPPIRLRELVSEFAPVSPTQGIYSLCNESMDYPFDDLVRQLGAPSSAGCFPVCAANTQGTQGGLVRPACEVASREGGATTAAISECLRENDEYLMDGAQYIVPCLDGSNTCSDADRQASCYAMLTDTSQVSATTSDDIETGCLKARANVQFKVQYRDVLPPGTDAAIEVSCQPSATPDQDCPPL